MGRVGIISAALLFLLITIARSLPDTESIKRKLDDHSIAGYERVSVTTPYREPVLAEFYDSPINDLPSSESSAADQSSHRQKPIS